MKNLLFLGAVALLLFGLSAALSLWLNQTRQDTADKKKDADPALSKNPGDAKSPEPKPLPKLPPISAGADLTSADQAKREQEKLERKALQISMVIQDVQAQRDVTDALLRQVTAELKTATKNPEPDQKAVADLKKQQDESRATEKKNLEKLAAVYDVMTAEGAAPILKAMAESGTGKMEQAAQILALMKERNSAKLLETIAQTDTTLAAQLADKVLKLKSLSPAPPPRTP